MDCRITPEKLFQIQPKASETLHELDAIVKESGLDEILTTLVRIRASQINNCGFCLDMHFKEARMLKIDQQKLDILSAWQELPFFSQRERAALALCEQITTLQNKKEFNVLFHQLEQVFTQEEIVNLTIIIVTINSWNRIVACMNFIPERINIET